MLHLAAEIHQASFLRGFVIFLIVLALLVLLAMGKALLGWLHLRRLGSDIGWGEFFALRSRGIKVSRIAAAEWMVSQGGVSQDIPRNVWVSFAMLKVDVLKLAAAVVAASQCNIDAGVGVLGAAALSGYDPVEVVRQAAQRNVGRINTETLNELTQWGLQRQDSPV